MKLVIRGKLAGLNEYVDACRRDPRAGNRMKREAEETVNWYAKASLRGKIPTPCVMHYTWYEPNRKRDMDNISAFGRKVIQDALVKAKHLPGDGWAHIRGFTDTFLVDRKNPRIEVTFEFKEAKVNEI